RRRSFRRPARLLALLRGALSLAAAHRDGAIARRSSRRGSEHADEPILSRACPAAQTISGVRTAGPRGSAIREPWFLRGERRGSSRLFLSAELRPPHSQPHANDGRRVSRSL